MPDYYFYEYLIFDIWICIKTEAFWLFFVSAEERKTPRSWLSIRTPKGLFFAWPAS